MHAFEESTTCRLSFGYLGLLVSRRPFRTPQRPRETVGGGDTFDVAGHSVVWDRMIVRVRPIPDFETIVTGSRLFIPFSLPKLPLS